MVSKTAMTPEHKKKVFLITKSLFGNGDQVPATKNKVKEFVIRHQHPFAKVTRKTGNDSVVDTIWNLKELGVFSSEAKAKLVFPGLYQPSPQRTLQRKKSERIAAKSEAAALERVVTGDPSKEPVAPKVVVERSKQAEKATTVEQAVTGGPSQEPVVANLVAEQLKEAEKATLAGDGTLPLAHEKVNLFPTYLTLKCQHVLLNFVQSLLEACCYNFAVRRLPAELQKMYWPCVEAVELNLWGLQLRPHLKYLPQDAINNATIEMLNQTLVDVATIRHTAVHRLTTTTMEVQRLLQKGLDLARMVMDENSSLRMEILVQHLSTTARNIELHKNNLESELDSRLEEIAEQRKELDRQEQSLVREIINQDKEDVERICETFTRSITALSSGDFKLTKHEFEEAEEEPEMFDDSEEDLTCVSAAEVPV